MRIRLLFAAIASAVGFACIGYAVWLSQLEYSSERRVRAAPEFGVVSFALNGSLCVMSAAVVLSNRREDP